MLLIFYPPGARGDFFASILNGLPTPAVMADRRIIIPNDSYLKMHDLTANGAFGNSFESIIGNRSVRISLREPEEFLTCAYLWSTKDLPSTPEPNDMMDFLLEHEACYQKINMFFNHVVRFRNLFDVEFLKKFYRQYNNAELPESFMPGIAKNISLQERVTVQNAGEFMPTLDVGRFLSLYSNYNFKN
jgi:hypothetical protein